MDAMRASMQKMIASPVPVVTYVTPQGARAGFGRLLSFGGGRHRGDGSRNNTGAAHPVVMGTVMDPVMRDKLENDAAALFAEHQGQRFRNVTLARVRCTAE